MLNWRRHTKKEKGPFYSRRITKENACQWGKLIHRSCQKLTFADKQTQINHVAQKRQTADYWRAAAKIIMTKNSHKVAMSATTLTNQVKIDSFPPEQPMAAQSEEMTTANKKKVNPAMKKLKKKRIKKKATT